ncbi:MAG: poly-gamma-glutamate hydrolase family protein [Elusimicrobiota bacterium]|nr:poly-gamma-glutamate hydrolase family protein [Elusimicrobiota bacterium]
MKVLKFILPCAILFSAACSAGDAGLRRGGDFYPGFAALKASHTEGLDYSREFYDRGSPVSVFAIHGGDIENTTARLARRVASGDLNLYIFNGWLGRKSGRLHVTATRFDDPDAVRLAASAVLGVSFHAQVDRGAWVCVGGANQKAAAMVAKRLDYAGFVAVTPCERLPGTSPKNIVNRPSAGGVQLELTLRLLASLEKDEEELAKFSGAVRQAAFEFTSTAAKKQ